MYRRKGVPAFLWHDVEKKINFRYSNYESPDEVHHRVISYCEAICPKIINVPLIQIEVKKLKEKIELYMNGIDSYIVSMSQWLYEEIEQFNFKVERKRIRILDEYCLSERDIEQQLTNYKFELAYEITSERWPEIENSITYIANWYLRDIFYGFFTGEMSAEIIEHILKIDDFYKQIISNILKFVGKGSLIEVLTKLRAPDFFCDQ
ncbi:MAG: hypothetical protein RR774_07060 [Acinetobacter sp.]